MKSNVLTAVSGSFVDSASGLSGMASRMTKPQAGISAVDKQHVRIQFEKIVVFVSWQATDIRDFEMGAGITS